MHVIITELIMSLAYCKIFWKGVWGTTFFSKKVSPGEVLSSSPSPFVYFVPSWLNQNSCLKALRMPDQRKGNHVQIRVAIQIRPNMAASTACPCLPSYARACARVY